MLAHNYEQVRRYATSCRKTSFFFQDNNRGIMNEIVMNRLAQSNINILKNTMSFKIALKIVHYGIMVERYMNNKKN